MEKGVKEVLFKQQIEEITNEVANCEGDKCAMCGKGIGEVPIQEEDTHRTLWVCEYCDSEMFDNSLESKGLKVFNEENALQQYLVLNKNEGREN